MPSDYPDAIASYLPRAFAIMLRAYIFEKPAPGSGIPHLDDRAFPTFLHEVAHLIQDRATFRGVMDFMDMWDQITAVSEYARSSAANIPFPITDPQTGASRLGPDHKWASEVAAFLKHREPKQSWTRGRFWAFENYNVDFRTLPLSGRQIECPFVTARFVDYRTGDVYSHPLGAWEIKEAYSVAVALLHGGPEMQPEHSFEYLAIERILARYFGQVSPEQTIAICHWALQDLAPANTLFALIERFEENFKTLPPWEKIYDVGREEALGRDFKRNCHDLLRSVQATELALNAQDATIGNMFGWFREHADALLKLHVDHSRRFPLDTFLCQRTTSLGPDEKRAGLTTLFKEVEVPLIVWPEGEFYSINADQRAVQAVFLNRCVSDLFVRLWVDNKAEWQCPIYNGCMLEIKDNLECQKTPWRKNKFHPTCPYGAAAKVLNIRDGKDLTFVPF